MEEKYFTKQEALETIKEILENYNMNYYDELHQHAFNETYYIVGNYEAEKALEEYGVFKALDKIREYEQDNFGEIYTDISSPERVANMLWYIIGEEVIRELDIDYNDTVSEEKNKELLGQIVAKLLQIHRLHVEELLQEETKMKLYLNNIENVQNIIVFEEIQDDWLEDENGFYTTNQENYDWWQTLANAIEFLNDNNIDAKINELSDYITVAQENGFNA